MADVSLGWGIGWGIDWAKGTPALPHHPISGWYPRIVGVAEQVLLTCSN